MDDQDIKRQIEKDLGVSVVVTRDNDIIFGESGNVWNYVGMDVEDAASRLTQMGHVRSPDVIGRINNSPELKVLNNAVENRGVYLTEGELNLLSIFDSNGVEDYLLKTNALSPEHQKIISLAGNEEVGDVEQCNGQLWI